MSDDDRTGAPATDPRIAPLALDAEHFRRIGHELVDTIASLLAALPAGRLTPAEAPEEVRAAIDANAPVPFHGCDPGPLLADTARLLGTHSLFNGHPRFFGYITSAPAPIGMLGDFLASAINANVGAWRLSPMASEIEAQAVRWIADLLGYPAAAGIFVSGGNMANMVGFLAARAAAAPWDLRADGVAARDARPLRIYASAETHTWIHKAADLSGLGTEAIRWIPAGDDQRMQVAALREALARDRDAGAVPMIVIGTAGTVSTGAVDPLADIAAVCREEKVWFHVDGAYGAFAAAVPGTPADLRAVADADSVAVDPHKWLYAPLEAGCLLVRDADRLRAAFAYHPPYYHFGQAATNFVDFGPQNSRGFRALKVWLALKQVGREGYVQMIADDIRLSERMFAAAAAHPEIEACTQSLSIATYRYVPRDLRARRDAPEVAAYLNDLNEAVLERIQLSGEVFVSNAVIGGRYLLRACIVNFHTGAADVDAAVEIAVRLGREADSELRPPDLRG